MADSLKAFPDIFLQEWNSNLENSPKALNYRLYKQIFEFENYFNTLENKDIFTFCKFRTTNTKLPIETGRWNNSDHPLSIKVDILKCTYI
jgi:hypothetical protein